jgi:glycosyltransferase involved in cell wall biosynthesis
MSAPPTSSSSVSVVIPCYNYGCFLPECVASVLDQEGVAVRVLILDDASTDDSVAVATRLAAADSGVEVRTHARNQGHVSMYNEGIDWATDAYTVLLDADDLLAPGALQRTCALLDAHAPVGFAYGPALVFEDSNTLPPPPPAPAQPQRWIVRDGREWFAQRCRVLANCIYSPEVVMRTRLLHELGGYRAELPHTADFELWMRLALHGDVGYAAGPYQAYYRDHSRSMHRVEFRSELGDLAQVAAAFEAVFRAFPDTIPDRELLEASVRRRLAERALLAAWSMYDRGPWQPAEVDGFERLARHIYAGADELADMRRLRRRRWLGPRLWRAVHPMYLRARRRGRADRPDP